MLVQIKLVGNRNFPKFEMADAIDNYRSKFNNFAKKPFFFHFQILIIHRSAILKFWEASYRKDSSEFVHIQSMYYSIRAICYIEPNQNYKHLCFREHLAWTPLAHFVPTVLDLLRPIAGLFQSEQTMQAFSFFPGKFAMP